MLPVNEEYFQITANDRRVKVPDNFRLNGIGVKGDQIAETVYFRINRYFDYMDLNNTNIYIQWECIDDKGTKHSGVSSDWVRDIQSDPDYLIFGWAITDEITAHNGQVKFSVRFVNWDESKENIVYSLGTIEQTITVNRSLDVELNLAEINLAIQELEQLVNSSVKPSYVVGTDKAGMPIFVLTLVDYIKEQENYYDPNSAGNPTSYYAVDLDPDTKKYKFKIQALPSDGEYVEYEWYIMSNNGIEYTKLTGNNVVDYYERVLTDEQIENKDIVYADKDQIYYTAIVNDGSITGYEIDTSLNMGDSNVIKENHYIRYGQCIAETAGKYLGVAVNKNAYDETRLPLPTSENINASYGPISIPSPEHSIINMSNHNYLTLNQDFSLIPEVIHEYADNEKEYQWYKNGFNEENKISQSLILEIPKSENYNTDLQGKYYLDVTAHRNNESITTRSETPAIITYNPDIITGVLFTEQNNERVDGIINPGDSITISPTLANEYQLPEYTHYLVQWYKVSSQGKTLINIDENNPTGRDALTLQILSDYVGYGIECEIKNEYNNKILKNEQGEDIVYTSPQIIVRN